MQEIVYTLHPLQVLGGSSDSILALSESGAYPFSFNRGLEPSCGMEVTSWCPCHPWVLITSLKLLEFHLGLGPMALGGLCLSGKISDRCSLREEGLVWLTVSEISMPVACTEGGLEIEWLPHRG